MGRDGYAGLAILAASLALCAATLGLETHPLVPVGPGFYPRIVLGVTAALSLLLVAADIWAQRRRGAQAAASPRLNHALVLLNFGVFALYVLALPYLGFRLSTFAFVAAMQATLDPPHGARRWIAAIAIALAASAVTYYVFEGYLQVLLPRGRWTGF